MLSHMCGSTMTWKKTRMPSGFWMQGAVPISIFLPLQSHLIIFISPFSGHVSNNRAVKGCIADKKIFEVRVNYTSYMFALLAQSWALPQYLRHRVSRGQKGIFIHLLSSAFYWSTSWGLPNRMICIHKLPTNAVGLGKGDHSKVYLRKIFNRRAWFKWSLCFS